MKNFQITGICCIFCIYFPFLFRPWSLFPFYFPIAAPFCSISVSPFSSFLFPFVFSSLSFFVSLCLSCNLLVWIASYSMTDKISRNIVGCATKNWKKVWSKRDIGSMKEQKTRHSFPMAFYRCDMEIGNINHILCAMCLTNKNIFAASIWFAFCFLVYLNIPLMISNILYCCSRFIRCPNKNSRRLPNLSEFNK